MRTQRNSPPRNSPPQRTRRTQRSLSAGLKACTAYAVVLLKPPTDSWPTYHGDYTGRRYSTLTQVNADNIKNLQLAWVYRLNTSQVFANVGGEGPDVAPAAANGFGPPTIKSTP